MWPFHWQRGHSPNLAGVGVGCSLAAVGTGWVVLLCGVLSWL
jgi:hypothetical protein